MCQEEREEEDVPAQKTALTHRYNDLMITYKSAEEDWLQPPEIILTTRHEDQRNDNNQKTKVRRKQHHGRLERLTSDNPHEKTWTWLRKGNLTREAESLLIAAQNNAIRTNHIQARIDKTQQNSRCKLCGDRDETINHIISECSKLAQKECKTRHD